MRAIKARWAVLQMCRRFDSMYVCVREITRLKSYQAHLFLHVAPLRCRVVCEDERRARPAEPLWPVDQVAIGNAPLQLNCWPMPVKPQQALISCSQSFTACGSTGADGGLLKGLSKPTIKRWIWSQIRTKRIYLYFKYLTYMALCEIMREENGIVGLLFVCYTYMWVQ